jgi:hypothetical protein
MPVTISGDAHKRIEALAAGLSDERLRDLTIQLRDSLVGVLRNTEWGTGDIGRGLTQYTEPVRTATGGWMVGVGSLEILHREPAPPHTIKDFLEWYRSTYRPARKERRAAEKAIEAKKLEPSPVAKETARIRSINVGLFAQSRIQIAAGRAMSDISDKVDKLWRTRNAQVRLGNVRKVAAIDIRLRRLRVEMELARVRETRAYYRIQELRSQR